MASNNFFLNNDPLLYQNPFSRGSENAEALQRQLNESMIQYKLLQQQAQSSQPLQQGRDYVDELDKLMKRIDGNTVNILKDNEEYQKLNNDLTSLIQAELMSSVKWKLNNNQTVIKNIERQTEIINEATKTIEEEKTKNLNELNDYVKNYSDITFDEYKKIKNKQKKENHN